MAHEINNPLAGMLVAVDNLKRRGGLEAQTERTIGLIERGLQHIRETVAALLVEARMEARDLKPQDIEDVHTLARTQCEKANVRLIWRNRLDHALELPSTPIRQVLLNLLLNAADAAAPGGKVMCELLVADGRLNIILENDGAPIPPEQAQHLFEPFYSTRPDGTGLGLWITYQIVQQLHGDIQLASNHRLSRFHIQIPLQPPPGERSVA
ncbi:MAG: HAMP domain-containing histidine kinase [Gammaproteobacteria bacterium]|nr:HAMP domain-containing histidine kinase [Gammaproteobacteria bacterium]NIX86538.1 hypothetical protein [Gammaproteobacteria bacterium]